jgi:hypothetical protein
MRLCYYKYQNIEALLEARKVGILYQWHDHNSVAIAISVKKKPYLLSIVTVIGNLL